jgi:DNA-binding NtrC family response regulator
VRTTLGMLLESAGYTLLSADDCTSGLALFKREHPKIKLVVTDMMLPDGNGVDLIEAMRAVVPTQPIVAISGLMATGEFDALLRLQPAVECLCKPMTSKELLGAVSRALKPLAQ